MHQNSKYEVISKNLMQWRKNNIIEITYFKRAKYSQFSGDNG